MFDNLYLVFIIGFFSGIGFFSLLFFLRKEKKIKVKEDTDLTSLKNYMQSIGGKLSVESETGKGSCFTLVFPLD